MNQGAHTMVEHRNRFRLFVWGAMIAPVFLVGCPNRPSSTDTDHEDLALEVGVLRTGVYHQLSDREALTVVHGAQGGIHVLVSLRLIGFSPGGRFLVTQRGVLSDTGDLVAPDVSVLVTFSANADGSNELDDQRVGLDLSAGSLDGRQATLTFTISDPNDTNLTVSTSVLVTFADASS